MSKPVKALIEREIASRLKDVEAVAVINPRGINAIKNNRIRRRLREKGVRMMVVQNSLVKRASPQTKLRGFEKLLNGPSALVWGAASISTIARLLLDEKKNEEKLELRGVFFDGEVYDGEEGVRKVSRLPTREEAIGLVVAAILAPARNLAGAIKGQAGKIAAILKTIEEKAKKEQGDAALAAIA